VPHADNTNWISLLVGQPVPRTDIWSVEEIPAVRAGWDLTHLNTNTPDLERLVEHHVLGSPGGRELTAEVYVPRGAGPFPVLVYAHGGGWCFGSAAGVRRPVTRLAEAGFLTININYALAPEQPFPAAVEDMVFALRWADAHAAELGGDPRRLLAGGDSAGANLAAAAAHVLHGDPTAVQAHGLAPEPVRLSGLLLLFGCSTGSSPCSTRARTTTAPWRSSSTGLPRAALPQPAPRPAGHPLHSPHLGPSRPATSAWATRTRSSTRAWP
jgi:hypothetical protein